MAQFFTGSALNVQLENLIKEADTFLFFVSPYIKLHDRLKEVLNEKKENTELKILILFGKNESDKSKSLSSEEFEYFKKFPNLEIRYNERLHAKCYANENITLLTSMNLYDYSFEKNIEFGVLTEKKRIGQDSLDRESHEYFIKVFDQSELVYRQKAVFSSSFLGFKKNFDKVAIEIDNSNKFFSKSYRSTSTKEVATRLSSNRIKTKHEQGFCIRCRSEIELNPHKPYCWNCFEVWVGFQNEDYAENYCHYSGVASNLKTSMRFPVLRKHEWRMKKFYNSF